MARSSRKRGRLGEPAPTHAGSRASSPQLYNLADDPAEERDVAAEHPARVRELAAAYDRWFYKSYRRPK